MQARLAHVGDIEQSRGGTALQVLGYDSGGILDRQRVAAERDHLAAELRVQVVERSALGVDGVVVW
jgi:hypothetical protein